MITYIYTILMVIVIAIFLTFLVKLFDLSILFLSIHRNKRPNTKIKYSDNIVVFSSLKESYFKRNKKIMP